MLRHSRSEKKYRLFTATIVWIQVCSMKHNQELNNKCCLQWNFVIVNLAILLASVLLYIYQWESWGVLIVNVVDIAKWKETMGGKNEIFASVYKPCIGIK